MFQDLRWRRFWSRLALFQAAQFTAFLLLGRSLFGSFRVAVASAALLTAVSGLGAVLYTDTVWSDTPTGRRRRVIVTIWATAVGLCVALGLRLWLTLPWAVVVAAGLTAALTAGVVYGRQSPRTINAMQVSLSIMRIESPAEAQDVIRDCSVALERPDLPNDRRLLTELNQARARTMLALRRGHGHELQAALATLRQVLQDSTIDPVWAVMAADDLVNAMSLAAEQTRDPQGYAEARELLAYWSDKAPEVEAEARVHAHRAGFHLFLARDGDAGHYWLALAAQQQAVNIGRPPSADHVGTLGVILSQSYGVTGQDRSVDAIQHCRDAVAQSHGDRVSKLQLAQCLYFCAAGGIPGSGQCIAEARSILEPLARRPGPLGIRAKGILVDLDGLI
ncbi:hypothetical protein [Actinoplanes sp. TFC3]|uniref:hypothetical protein n=1 Tax=Actinoplanes sp. TFC3 TaxID=1710355 RepID=UPI00082E9F61|nr:hypothetical protein [Actinoplanes sp. TFC3]